MEVRTAGHFIRIDRNQRPCMIAVLAHACHVLSGCRCKLFIFRQTSNFEFDWDRSDLNVAETGFECATLACRSWLYAITGVGLEYDFHLFTPWEIDGAQIVWMPVHFFFLLRSNLWMNSNTHPISFITLNRLPYEHDAQAHIRDAKIFISILAHRTPTRLHRNACIDSVISLACHPTRYTHTLNEWKPTNRRINSISCTLKTCDAYPYSMAMNKRRTKADNFIHDAMPNSNRNNNNNKRQSNVVWALIKYYFVFLLTHRTLNGISTPSIPMWRRAIHATATAM